MTDFAAAIVIPLKTQVSCYLEQCVQSAVTQTVPSQVIVITSQDTPSDNLDVLTGLARLYPNLRVQEGIAGSGFAQSLNQGIALAETERVGFLLSDDWLLETAVEYCLAHSADIVCTGHCGYSADGQQQFWERRLSIEAFEQLQTLEQKANYLTHFFLFKRSALLEVGGVDPGIGLTGADDYDLPWTMLERGASVAMVPEPQYCVHDHDGTRLTLRDPDLQIADLRKIFAKHGVASDEVEQLIEIKRRWYGVPTHVAMASISAKDTGSSSDA
ncbi:MAG: glycosyltransferase family A protein [Pseudomonadota bacterium]